MASAEYHREELETPQWLNAEFLTHILKRTAPNASAIEVNHFQLSPATTKDGHYASVMFRVVVDYHDGAPQTKSMIIKTTPDEAGQKKDLIEQMQAFETEIGIYGEVLPRFERLLSDAGDETRLGPRCLYHSMEPRKLIVLEDIVPLGYIVLPSRDASLEQIKGAYLKLAKWHAVGYYLAVEEPTLFGKYRYNIMTNAPENNFASGGLQLFLEMLDTQPQLSAYKPHFEALRAKMLSNVCASFSEYHKGRRAETGYTLCHGDFHAMNLMFRHELGGSGRLNDVMLLDFQATYMGPLVNDLIYSTAMLLSAEQRRDSFESLLSYYYEHFAGTLRAIGFAGALPQLSDLKAQLLAYKDYELFMLVTILPAWQALDDNVDLGEMMASADVRRPLYKTEKYLQHVATVLPMYLSQGYFDKQ